MAKVLIIDDDNTILVLFKFIYEDAGHEVILAKNGQVALDSLAENVPDFMIVDVAMPVMSGREFIVEYMKRAEDDPRLGNIPFVVMTGENYIDMESNKIFTVTPGFVSFFPKMTPPEHVYEASKAYIEQPA